MSGTIAWLDRLLRHDTVSNHSNLPLIDEVAGFLTECGFRVTRLADPEAPKAGIHAEIGPAGRGVVLSAHSDVVPVAGQAWTRDPFHLTREGSRLFGRGATDMKGFLAAMLNAADKAAGMDLAEPLKLVISYDEEVGCVGISRMRDRLEPLLGDPRLVIVGEPTGMRVATGHKGKRSYRADIFGQEGHSALAPRYVNAIDLAASFIGRLNALQEDLVRTGARDDGYDIPHSTVHVGLVSGGRALNIVPGRAQITYEFRYLPGDDPDDLERRIGDAAAALTAGLGEAAAIRITRLSAYPGLEARDPAALKMLQDAGGRGTCKVAFGTEAGVFNDMGLPALVCGPGSMDGQGHKPDEFIDAGDLAECDAMLSRILGMIAVGADTKPAPS